MNPYLAAVDLLLSIIQTGLILVILYFVRDFYLRDKARAELVEALSKAFVDKDSKLLKFLNDKCGNHGNELSDGGT